MDSSLKRQIEDWVRERWAALKSSPDVPKEFLSILLMEGSDKFRVSEATIYSVFADLRARGELRKM